MSPLLPLEKQAHPPRATEARLTDPDASPTRTRTRTRTRARTRSRSYATHLLKPRLGDLVRAALAHGAVLHHALPVLLPEGALQVQVHLVVLEEVSGKKEDNEKTHEGGVARRRGVRNEQRVGRAETGNICPRPNLVG